jgi:hypothetical protein
LQLYDNPPMGGVERLFELPRRAISAQVLIAAVQTHEDGDLAIRRLPILCHKTVM